MKILVLALLVAAPATAQNAQPTPPSLEPRFDAGPFSPGIVGGLNEYQDRSRPNLTPQQQRDRLERALALRDEYQRFAVQDGGTLTKAHLAYVQRKARQILSGQD